MRPFLASWLRSRCLHWATLPSVLSACVSAPLGTSTGTWQTLETPHFTLHTDLARPAAEEQAHTLEAQLAAMHRAGWEATGDVPQRVHVVMFANNEEFRQFGGEKHDGYMVHNILFEPWIVMPAPTPLTGIETLTHELAHFMAFQAMQSQPPWFAEGLASYFQTAQFMDDGSFQLGRVPLALFRQLTAENWIPPSKLVSGWAERKSSSFYPSSWLFVHYLMTRRPDEFAAYQGLLARAVGHERAFSEVFEDTPEQLDEKVRHYARDGRYEVFAFRISVPKAEISVRTLSRADQYSLRALLWSNTIQGENSTKAAEDIARALALEPMQLEASALALLEARDTQGAYQRARTLVEKHPHDWRAWVTLGLIALQAGRFEELAKDARRDPGAKALALAPTQPYAVMMAAFSASARGARTEGLRLAARSERMQPTNVALMQLRTDLLIAFSECAALAQSLSRLGEIGHGQVEPEQLKRLTEVSAACHSP